VPTGAEAVGDLAEHGAGQQVRPVAFDVVGEGGRTSCRSLPPRAATIRCASPAGSRRTVVFGEAQRADIGAVKTRARWRSVRARTSFQAPPRSTPAPTTNAGRSLASSAAPIAARTAASQRGARLTRRGSTGAQARAQSSDGIETSTGPRGGCMAR
jgi:hypothetical protein